MTNYASGRSWEYQVRDWYSKRGYQVIRSAGSKSPVDLIAIDHKEVIFVQCKKELKKKNYMDDLAALRGLPRAFWIRKELWVKRKTEVSIYSEFGDKILQMTLKELKNG